MGVYALLHERFPALTMERDLSFARRTTIGCGGVAEVSASPSDAEEAAQLLSFLIREHIPYAFLGVGANTLPPDGYCEGVLIRSDGLRALVRGDNSLFAGAGVTGGALCRYAREHCIGGFEPFTGIPMSVGGACTMNAGVSGGHISDVALRVLAVKGGRICSFPLASCGFGEKTSIFGEEIFVVGVLFRAESVPREKIEQRTDRFRLRRAHLPKGRSMGCTFVNPNEGPAGEIIERCGLKGFRIGGAHVSAAHANFILNDGGTVSDVAAVIDTVKQVVYRRTGILLREEIRRLSFASHT